MINAMPYNLTEKQKEFARALVEAIRKDGLPETFALSSPTGELRRARGGGSRSSWPKSDQSTLRCLELAQLLVLGEGWTTVTGRLFEAVDTNFSNENASPPPEPMPSHPAEIAMSLQRLRAKYPDPQKTGFLLMRFAAAKPLERIVTIIKQTAARHGLVVIRADENEFHADLWSNVRTHLHGCGFGIAVYERIETDEPNANVGLEVGYLMAMNKPVLLLKDRTIKTLQTDLAGRLYKPFDPHAPDTTLPMQLEKWLFDYGIVVAPKPVESEERATAKGEGE
jgi:hypothetical protein